MAKENGISVGLEIVRLAMEINASKETEMQVFLEIEPHVSQISVRIFPHGWTREEHQCSVIYCASYDKAGKYYNKMSFRDGADTWDNIDCDLQRLLQEIREIAEKEVKSNG